MQDDIAAGLVTLCNGQFFAQVACGPRLPVQLLYFDLIARMLYIIVASRCNGRCCGF